MLVTCTTGFSARRAFNSDAPESPSYILSIPSALSLAHLTHRYGERVAVDDLSLEIAPGEIFVLLGPNGSGKTSLFRLLSTLIPIQSGEASLFGLNIRAQAAEVRQRLGVVFQAPSLDKKLTVAENLRHHGRLYGLGGAELARRMEQMLGRLKLTDRANDRVETLSGGLRRRAELAKGLLHDPQLLLLDEPSTGLDPAARIDLWRYLLQLRDEQGMTIVATTHLLDEAERADRIGIMHAGKLVALDTPAALQASVGGDTILIRTADPTALAAAINEKLSAEARVMDGVVRLEQQSGPEWLAKLLAAFGPQIQSVTLGKPTLEDVFIARTGHRFFDEPTEEPDFKKKKKQ